MLRAVALEIAVGVPGHREWFSLYRFHYDTKRRSSWTCIGNPKPEQDVRVCLCRFHYNTARCAQDEIDDARVGQ